MRHLLAIVGIIFATVLLLATSANAANLIRTSIGQWPQRKRTAHRQLQDRRPRRHGDDDGHGIRRRHRRPCLSEQRRQLPSDPKKQEVSGPVSNSGQFTSGKNGQITGSLTLSPPPPTLSCPPGQSRVLISVTYTNIAVSEPNAATQAIPGTFSRAFITL